MNEEILEMFSFFEQQYDACVLPLNWEGVKYLGSKQDQTCRFCQKRQIRSYFQEESSCNPRNAR